MARVKTVPTPRNSALSAAMRPPQPSLSPSSSTVTIETETTITNKAPVNRSQAVKVAKSTPTTRVKDTRSSSISSQKRKTPTEEVTLKSQPGISVTKVALRSGKIPTTTGQDIISAAAKDNAQPPSKRQKILEPTRRSSRNIKPTSNGHIGDTDDVENTTANKQNGISPPKTKTSVKFTPKSKQDKSSVVVSRTPATGEPATESTIVLETSPPAQSTRARTRTSSAEMATSDIAPSAEIQSKELPLPHRRYSYTSNDVVVDGPDATIKLPTSEVSSKWNSAGLPIAHEGETNPALLVQPLHDFKHVYPEVQADTIALSTTKSGVTPVPATNGSINTDIVPFQSQSATHTPTNYNRSQASSPSPSSSSDGSFKERRSSTTKGQKVKGKPNSNKSRSSVSAKDRGKNVANTYPRKQPFKAQIEYPNYPPNGAQVPDNYSMWEICQNFPNHLREGTLLAFVQREWSANELCACLREDVKEILYARPGKDKTMVYQKRMERIKKDLVAKGEYENLLNAPKIREDGRPSWVKRGNVRRK